MFEMAVSEKVIAVNPTTALYTPKTTRRSESQSMSAQQVELALGAVDFREKVILRLAVFAGMRPGELLAIQREHVKPDASVIEIRRRVYRGEVRGPEERFGPHNRDPSVYRLSAPRLDGEGRGPESRSLRVCG